CSSASLSAQDTVDRLLRLHFRDGRTRGTEAAAGGPARAGWASASHKCLVVAVNGDAQLLMAEMLMVFVRARPPGRDSLVTASRPLSLPFPFTCAAEAAARAARQAQAEDLKKVDIEHLEKVLPQLVCNC
ncbi:CENPX protein, partial [Menura novaehollandiae]|nr:CENPX protein [Menura novaehollandiae]